MAKSSKQQVSAGIDTEDASSAREFGKKQAVVIIHGMGEQTPMSTLRGFVDAVWTGDASLKKRYRPGDDETAPNQSWITPDRRTGSHELRRISTPYDVTGRRTDFYELYWADLTQGTTRQRLTAWVKSLLWRKRSDIPPDVVKLYRVTFAGTIVFALAAMALAFSFWQDYLGGVGVAIVLALASGLFWLLDHFVVPYFGDVAAYVRAEAGTVESRRQVRERGLGVLRVLMDDDDYDRIILVSHSLGTIIAYDLLQILWAEYRPKDIEVVADKEIKTAINAVGKYAQLPKDFPATLSAGQSVPDLRDKQYALYELLRNAPSRLGKRWKISDFVTLGSPLTHAEFLVTHNAADWRRGVMERQFSVCPPLSDNAKQSEIAYECGRNRITGKVQYSIHHAAPFAATRWTNIYDIGNLWSTGDPISGAMYENFGPGVEDIQVELKRNNSRLFTHTFYWQSDVDGREMPKAGNAERTHIDVLRYAVDLGRRGKSDGIPVDAASSRPALEVSTVPRSATETG